MTGALSARTADPLALSAPPAGDRGALRWIDWIWHVRGSLPLAPGRSTDEAFGRLDPLFHEAGTSVECAGDTLRFRKKDQAAQDKMSVFDGGVLRVERGAAGPVLRYHLISRALLFCFLAPFLFVAIGQFTLFTARFQPSTEAAAQSAKSGASAKALGAAKKPAAKPAPPMNPIDKMLGAPAPEKPKDGADKGSGRDKKPSATSAYVFAAMFAVLYLVGRILEDRLIRRLFRKKLLGA